MNRGILVVVAEGEHDDFVLRALSGAFKCAAVLKGKAMLAIPQLLEQGITVLVKVTKDQAMKVRAELVIFTEGCEGKIGKDSWLVWQPQGTVDERDKIVEKAILELRRRKLIKAL